MSSQSKGDVKDRSLSKEGIYRIEWAGREMPVLSLISKRFQKERPLEGLKVSGCLHITTETANLALVLKAGGAVLEMCASNPLSTQDEVAAALVTEYGVPTYAIKGEDDDTYYRHLNAVLDHKPNATMDDGADLIANIHQKRRELIEGIIGGTEETTTGVIRL
ncbi:MAG: adenosylhomocysteinase, partial [Dehalococcoidia bacterium]|nr:adenosylhomocysteinase [Dehalococcoidia bacterium]